MPTLYKRLAPPVWWKRRTLRESGETLRCRNGSGKKLGRVPVPHMRQPVSAAPAWMPCGCAGGGARPKFGKSVPTATFSAPKSNCEDRSRYARTWPRGRWQISRNAREVFAPRRRTNFNPHRHALCKWDLATQLVGAETSSSGGEAVGCRRLPAVLASPPVGAGILLCLQMAVSVWLPAAVAARVGLGRRHMRPPPPE